MTADECIEDIRAALLASGCALPPPTSFPSGTRLRKDTEVFALVDEIEATIEKYRVYGERSK